MILIEDCRENWVESRQTWLGIAKKQGGLLSPFVRAGYPNILGDAFKLLLNYADRPQDH